MYKALYRSYRPETFDEILGQEHIVKILNNQINSETISHAYLFCGTRGTGKTTTARLLAKGVNCTSENLKPCGICSNCISIKEGTFMDVIEMDAASNNGVENIRELRESVKYPPAVGKKKVYIIDEVHMLSTGAFNALLKTLEEPPENVMFILATTEAHKLPATILSRCLRLDFRRIPEKLLKQGMGSICKSMEVNISSEALTLVAANADGSVRDGLSLLDQCLASGSKDITRDDVLELLGAIGEESYIEMTNMVRQGSVENALILLNNLLADGKDARQFIKDWVAHYRNLLMVKFIQKPEDMLSMSAENTGRLKEQSEKLDLPEINLAIMELAKTSADARWSTQPRILLELTIVKLATGLLSTSVYANAQEEPKIQKKPLEKEKVAPKTEPIKSQAVSQKFDLEKIWHGIFEEGETSKGSFNLIRTGTELAEIKDTEFVIIASNDVIKNFVNENSLILSGLMEKHTGTKRALVCRIKNETEHHRGGDVRNVAKNLESKFGLNIEIE